MRKFGFCFSCMFLILLTMSIYSLASPAAITAVSTGSQVQVQCPMPTQVTALEQQDTFTGAQEFTQLNTALSVVRTQALNSGLDFNEAYDTSAVQQWQGFILTKQVAGLVSSWVQAHSMFKADSIIHREAIQFQNENAETAPVVLTAVVVQNAKWQSRTAYAGGPHTNLTMNITGAASFHNSNG